jgi:predicted enzyme related to lactoylglutathione lyase
MILTVSIDVDDLEKAREFYSRAFDLTVGRDFGPGVIELKGASSLLYLLQREAGSNAVRNMDAKRDYGRHWTPVHLDFVTDQIEPALERAVAAGAKQESSVRSYDWGRIAVCADPWGHGFCLVEYKP